MPDPGQLSCQEALERLLEFLDRELSGVEHDRVEQHLRACRSCYSRMEFESRLKGQLSALSAEEVPEAARDRIRDLIRRF